MTAVWLTKNTGVWYLVTAASLLLVIGGLAVLVSSIRARRNTGTILLAGLNLLAAFSPFMILMDCARYAYLSEPDPRYRPFQYQLFDLPWGLYAGLEAVLLLFLVLFILDDQRYRNRQLTPDAIRETVDFLPEGICIIAPDGTALLSNLQMETVCRALTGSGLYDAARLRHTIEAHAEKQNGKALVRMPGGKTWRFSQEQLTEDGRQYDLLTAADVTAQYRAIDELREKNERLTDIQRRMKAVSDLSGDMFIAREETDARAALHNQLGQVLLMGRYYLDHPDRSDANSIYLATKEMNGFLLREVRKPENEMEDEMQLVLSLAGSIGVSVRITGTLPRDREIRRLIAEAIRECAVNTVKHANGDTVYATIGENAAVLSNNGTPPAGRITESGGLLSLRRKAAAAGCTMVVESQPAFSLMIHFP